jgi:dTMP kinase
MKTQNGILIVIDGTDGCGKQTQVKKMIERLLAEGYQAQTMDFPRYYDNFFGKFVGECLAGEHGEWASVNPKIASVIYAADRWESSAQIKSWLNEGYVVILDRYVSSNQIHQGGKIQNSDERKGFMQWLDTMEHETFGIPRPDAIFYLDVPVKLTQELLVAKGNQESKKYLEGRGDQHETNPEHLENAKRSGLLMLAEASHWHRIVCSENGKMLSIESIHGMIYEKIKELL